MVLRHRADRIAATTCVWLSQLAVSTPSAPCFVLGTAADAATTSGCRGHVLNSDACSPFGGVAHQTRCCTRPGSTAASATHPAPTVFVSPHPAGEPPPTGTLTLPTSQPQISSGPLVARPTPSAPILEVLVDRPCWISCAPAGQSIPSAARVPLVRLGQYRLGAPRTPWLIWVGILRCRPASASAHNLSPPLTSRTWA